MMGGQVNTDDADRIATIIKGILTRLDELERPTGTQLAQTIKKVLDLFDTLDEQVAAAITANSYTKAQLYTKAEVDSLISDPGDIYPNSIGASGDISTGSNLAAAGSVSGGSMSTTGNFSAGGQVVSQAALRSPGSRSTTVTQSYVGAWIDVNGVIGMQPSSRRFKKNEELLDLDAQEFLDTVRAKRFHGTDQDDSDDKRIGVIAEEVLDAGFPELVPLETRVYREDYSLPVSVEYQMLVVPLLEIARQQQERLNALEERIRILESE